MRSIRIIIVAALIASVLIVSVPSTSAASDMPSLEWIKTFNGFQGNSVIQTSDGGYALAGATSVSGAASFV